MPLRFASPATRLSKSEIAAVGASAGLTYADLAAVCSVEASGSGFLPDTRPKILCEAHKFHAHTGGEFDGSHPRISSPTWDRSLYSRSAAGEYDRLAEMLDLDEDAAYQSSSWGLFQVLGENFKAAGFASAKAFALGMCTTELAHLKAAVSFMRANNLIKPLQRGDYDTFARGYNGPNYRENDYATKLAKAYKSAVSDTPAEAGSSISVDVVGP